jgi:hypothetical protein
MAPRQGCLAEIDRNDPVETFDLLNREAIVIVAKIFGKPIDLALCDRIIRTRNAMRRYRSDPR